MHMMVKKRQCKLVALFLLLVLLVPFVPVVPVAADPLPVQVPDFPYNQDSYYNVNNGGFALWQVHGSNHISYVQTFSSGAVGNPDPIVIYNRSFWADKSTYYLDVNYITDTWDIYGNHIDGWPGSNTSNIRLPYPFHDTVDSEVYATLVYCSDDVRWRNGSDTGIYMYMNYMVPGYSDPTPTPTPAPALPSPSGDYYFGFTYHQNGSGYDGHSFIFNDACANQQSYGDRAVAALTDGNLVYSFYSVWEHLTSDRYNRMAITEGSGIVFNSSTYSIGAATLFYDLDTSSYVSFSPFLQFNTASTFNSIAFSPNTVSKFGYKFGSLPDVSELGTFVNSSGSTYVSDFHFGTKAVYSYFGDGGSTPIATPTPTAVPTAIPQPSTTPAPTEPPDDGDDGNWTGLFGWLKKLVNAIISIPVKIVNGLLSALKYIFIPDIGKIKTLFNTLNDKFGINVPGTFEFDPILLKNPENVVMHFKPISLNGESTETVDITIIDFDKVDDWLESAPGQIIIRLIQAVYMLTMWGYMIYIFRKHIATINYTDADTLEHSKYWES